MSTTKVKLQPGATLVLGSKKEGDYRHVTGAEDGSTEVEVSEDLVEKFGDELFVVDAPSATKKAATSKKKAAK